MTEALLLIVKIGAVIALRFFLRIFWIMPVKRNRILFVSHEGRQYSCNPKYIFEALWQKHGNSLEYIWCLHNPSELPGEYKNIRLVSYKSFRFILYAVTARIIIANCVFRVIIPLRSSSQCLINTWHGGGAYKNSGLDIFKKNIHLNRVFLKLSFERTNYFISSSRVFSENMHIFYLIKESAFFPSGMPRNDLFFKPLEHIRKKVGRFFEIPDHYGIVLYVPTFRNNGINVSAVYTIDVKKIVDTLAGRFKKKLIFLYRKHHAITNVEYRNDGIDVSAYPDVQELLGAADFLISDYSSAMWDFSLTRRPCFIFAPDIKQYRDTRGFSAPPDTWPFPIAESNDELVSNIKQFDEDRYVQNIADHHKDLGSYEKGTAAQACVDLLETILDGQ